MKCLARSVSAVFLGAMALLAAPRFSSADTIYDVANDFSGSSDPNGAWTYGYISDGSLNMGNLVRFNATTGGTTPSWYVSSDPPDPNVYHNGSGAVIVDGGGYRAVNAVTMGPYKGPTVVEWTAPAAGTVTFTSTGINVQVCCSGTNNPGRPVDYAVYDVLGGTQNTLLAPTSIAAPLNYNVPSAFPSQSYNTSGPITVAKGDSIFFVASGAGDNNYNTMQLKATLDFVPEPASAAFIGVGALGMLLRRRRV